MSDKHYIGLDVTSFENTGKHKPVSRVTLFLDSENYYTAGDDTGKEITANCPSATQAMADVLLAKFKGYEHQSFNADAANIDPAVELGDGVTVGGIYATLSRIKDDGNGYAGIAAPDEPELEDEYPYTSPIQQEIKRQSTEIYSVISKTAEEISLEIIGLENAHSELELTLDGLTTRIQDVEGNVAELELTTQEFSVSLDSLEGEYTELALTLDGLTVTDSSGTTRIKGSSIETDTLYVNAANITGTLTADQIVLTGAITWSDLSSSVQGDIDEAWEMAYDASDAATEALDTVESMTYTYNGKTYIDESMIMAGTIIAGSLQGGTVSILNAYEEEIAYMSVGRTTSTGLQLVSGGNLFFESESCFIGLSDDEISVQCSYFYPADTGVYLGHASYGMWEAVYAYTSTIQTSDANLKNSIEYLDEKYLKFILWLTPKRYKMNNGTSNRYHVGFIAQDVQEGMELFEIDSLEFAGFIKDVDADGNEILMLRYEEFIGLLALALQSHEERLRKLEEMYDT